MAKPENNQEEPTVADKPRSGFQKPPRTGYFAPDKLHLLEPASASKSKRAPPGSPPFPPPASAKSIPGLDPAIAAGNDNADQNLAATAGKQSLEDERLPCSYLLINIIYVVWGVAGIGITLVLHLVESKSEAVLNFDESRTMDWIPTLLMYISSGLTVFAGVGGTLAFFVNFKHFLQLYRHFLWIVFVLDVYSAIFSYASWSHMNMMQYQQLLEAEGLFISSGDETYLNLWEPKYRRYWTLLQESFKCCGFQDAQDWISICNCVPRSCCRFDVPDCKPTIDQMNPIAIADPSTPFNYSVIADMIHTSGCEEVAILEQKSLQRDWIMFPLLISLFDFIFMLHGTELVLELRDLMETARGERVVRQFRRSIWCCRWLRKLLHRHHKKKAPPQRKKNGQGAGAEAFNFMALSLAGTSSSSEDENNENEEKMIQRSLYHAIRSKTRMIAGGLPVVRQRFQSPSHDGVATFVTDRISMINSIPRTPDMKTVIEEVDRTHQMGHRTSVPEEHHEAGAAEAGQAHRPKEHEPRDQNLEAKNEQDRHKNLAHRVSAPAIPHGAANVQQLPPHETESAAVQPPGEGNHDHRRDSQDHKPKHEKQKRREPDVKPTPARHQMHKTPGRGRGRVSVAETGQPLGGQIADDADVGQDQHQHTTGHEHDHQRPIHKPQWHDPPLK